MRSKCFDKELPSLSNFIQTKSIFGWARKGLGTSFTLECYAWFRGSGFPSKIAYVKTGDKGKLFILFLPLFTLSLLSKIVCSLWIHHSRVKQQWDLLCPCIALLACPVVTSFSATISRDAIARILLSFFTMADLRIEWSARKSLHFNKGIISIIVVHDLLPFPCFLSIS